MRWCAARPAPLPPAPAHLPLLTTPPQVMLGLSLLFGALPLQTALWAAAGCFAAVGLAEGLVGGRLVRGARAAPRPLSDEPHVPYTGA